jgi:glycosyltransferase involved in cell wall biosynthesis
LAKQKVPKYLIWEIVLVDNASTDMSKELAEHYWQSLGAPAPMITFDEPNAGTANARRAGVFAARYNTILFCDDDNWLSPDYLAIGWDFLKNDERVGLVGGQAEAVNEEPLPDWFDSVSPYYAASAPAPESRSFDWEGLWSAGLFGRTEILHKVFNPVAPFLNKGRVGSNTGCGEDAEMCLRTSILGYGCYYLDKLKFQHYIQTSRLTKEYAESLLSSIIDSSQAKAIYQRILFTKKLDRIERIFFIVKQLVKYYGPFRYSLSLQDTIICKDYLFILTCKLKYARPEAIIAMNFVKATK